MFWNKKPLTSQEYADLLNKYTKLEAETATLKHLFEKLENRFQTLQSSVSRKLDKNNSSDDDSLKEEIAKLQQFFGTPSQNYAATQSLLNRDTE